MNFDIKLTHTKAVRQSCNCCVRDETVERDLFYFIAGEIQGGIEDKIDKIKYLVTLLTYANLTGQKLDIQTVADTLGAEGRDFKIIEDNNGRE